MGRTPTPSFVLALFLASAFVGKVHCGWSVFGESSGTTPETRKATMFGRVREFETDINALKPVQQEGAREGSWTKSRYEIEPFPFPGPLKWEYLPKRVQDMFTLDGKIPYIPYFRDETSFDQSRPQWAVQRVDNMVKIADTRDPEGGQLSQYGTMANKAFFDAFAEHPVEGKRVLVVGSQVPWVEAILISFGAGSITTVDFNPPRCDHPKLKIISIPELDATDEVFDAIVSFSSIEHDGLGRYGDPINPNGDLLRMQKMKSLVKKDGKFYLGVPMGDDSVQFNAHRIYGPIRWPMLTDGWDVIGMYGACKLENCFHGNEFAKQPVAVLKLKD